tara:strand:- start:1886 stop:2113 length:228 start_codon:yes stop_codon:yes gene_type:complete
MQKLINAAALFAGAVSLAVVGTAGYVYIRKDAIIESVKEKALEAVMGSVTESLPSVDLPDTTGPAIPSLPTPPSL